MRFLFFQAAAAKYRFCSCFSRPMQSSRNIVLVATVDRTLTGRECGDHIVRNFRAAVCAPGARFSDADRSLRHLHAVATGGLGAVRIPFILVAASDGSVVDSVRADAFRFRAAGKRANRSRAGEGCEVTSVLTRFSHRFHSLAFLIWHKLRQIIAPRHFGAPRSIREGVICA
jgi:hypothetical protein